MRPIYIDMDLDAVDANGVFEDQTLGGAGDFTLDGAGVTGGEWVSPDGFAKQIGFESAGNISAVTFTVTGYLDAAKHLLVTETLSGPNAGTVETSNYFHTITSIAADGAVGTNTEAGPVDEAVSQIIPLNTYGGPVSVTVELTGTGDYSIEHTGSDITDASLSPFNWVDSNDSNIVGATTDQFATIASPSRAIRLKVNSYSTNARLQCTINQTVA